MQVTTEQKALALAIEVRGDDKKRLCPDPTLLFGNWEALCRAIEQHEAFKQEVSDIVRAFMDEVFVIAPWVHKFKRLVIPKPKPDPLVDVLKDFGGFMPDAEDFRAALKAHGLEIRSKNDD